MKSVWRYQNPGSAVFARWLQEEPGPARVLLELASGSTAELDVAGKRSEDILGEVMRSAGAPEEDIAPSVAWAADYLKGRPASAKPHEMRRELDEEELEEPAADDGEQFGPGEEAAPALVPSR